MKKALSVLLSLFISFIILDVIWSITGIEGLDNMKSIYIAIGGLYIHTLIYNESK
jgi:hypothetical protein